MSTVPSGYQAPKTNWQAADIVHPSDFNRIEGDIQAIETGNRTLDQTQVPTSNTGNLRQLLDWFANRIRAITGATNWYDAPATTLAAAKSHIDALDPSVRFQVSGCVGGSTNITLSSGGIYGLQTVSLAVPSGKSLILKRARFDMLVDLRLRIATGFFPLNVIWTSESIRGEVTLNVLVSNENPLVTVWVQAFNPTAGSVDLQPHVGWWLDFAIVDA